MSRTIRNVTIVAHIDHGKTTLADSLLAANNFISQRMAGSARLMDYLPEEAARGITMKASSAALSFRFPNNHELQLNLIDSPGHVDFSYEVASAFSLSDGAILLIDVVEGICPQTAVLLKMAMKLKIKPILVLNKIDRLFDELKFTPDQAYDHLFASVTSANALFATIANELGSGISVDNFFCPEKGNVIFASAFDGWGFQLSHFAYLYSDKLNLDPAQLTQFLWGFYFFDPKTRTVIDQKQLGNRKLKPLFVQLILNNIWDIYQAVMVDRDVEKIQKITSLLKINVLPRELKSKETRSTLKIILSQWLPLASSVVTSIKNHLPSPSEAQQYRLEASIPSSFSGRDLILQCSDSLEAPTVVFVSKMFPILTKDLPKNKRNFSVPKPRPKKDVILEEALPLEDLKLGDESPAETITEPEEVLIAFARIFSGILKEGDSIHVLGPKFDASEPELHHTKTTISSLFLMKGRDLEQVHQVYAGQVFAIMGLQDIVLKSATLTSNPLGPNLGSVILEPPIVRVAVEPQDASNMDKFVRGLGMLNQADPCVEIILQDSGEHVLCTAGELHLERCIKDLKEIYAKVPIHTSPPIVPFRETITESPALNLSSEEQSDQVICFSTPNQKCTVQLKAIPIPDFLVEIILNYPEEAKLWSDNKEPLKHRLFSGLDKYLEENKTQYDWHSLLEDAICFGPKKSGPNCLINLCHNGKFEEYASSIISGFQLFVNAGPLCAEPVSGVCIVLHDISIEEESDKSAIMGQLVSTVREGCKQCFLRYSPRISLALYQVDLQAPSEVLGKVYGVLSRRKGKILKEEMSAFGVFNIQAHIPVIESFGFADELRKRTSGMASPQLMFHGYEILDEDPYWVPTTEEELEDLGEKADKENIARKYMNQVRERKGMFVDKKIVEHAEKQKTLKNK